MVRYGDVAVLFNLISFYISLAAQEEVAVTRTVLAPGARLTRNVR